MIDFFEYSELVSKLNTWVKAYDNGNSLVSDDTYDTEYKKLKEFELYNPEMIESNSPTQKILSGTSGFPKVNHDLPMLSIANSMSLGDLEEWSIDKINKNSGNQTIEYKIDGLALSLKYIDGQLSDAVTRGDGKTGDRVLANALRINNIPKVININGIVEIRGEVVWYKSDFDAYNKYLESIGRDLLSNPRNGASGTMKSKDPQEVTDRKLSFIAYSFVQGSLNKLQSEDLEQLRTLGFSTSDYFICTNSTEVVATSIRMQTNQYNLPYLIDGLVIKVDDKRIYKSLGGTSKTPHYCTALKFPPQVKTTHIVDIENSYGRSGAVTPVAIVDEVELALTNVRRASLHNWDMLEYLGLYKGCKVKIRKAGEIIPEIFEVVGIGRTKNDYEKLANDTDKLLKARIELNEKYTEYEWYSRPHTCIHCNSKLTNLSNNSGDQLVAWGCINTQCSVKHFKNIVRFVSKEAMNIMGIGESVIESLLSHGKIKKCSDLYSLTENDFLEIDGIKDRSAKNYYTAIQQSKVNGLDRLLIGLGISNLGKTTSGTIANKFGSLTAFRGATESDLNDIELVGNDLIKSILEWLSDSTNQLIIDELIHYGVALTVSRDSIKSNKLTGCTLIMTGTSDTIGRDEFKKMVNENGGTLASSITKKVTHVLMGDGAGPAKVKKIEDINNSGGNIIVLNDTEFMELIK